MATPRDPAGYWAALETLDCLTCGSPMPFEPVDCVDGHGDDCPDRVCVACGFVVVVGPAPLASRLSA